MTKQFFLPLIFIALLFSCGDKTGKSTTETANTTTESTGNNQPTFLCKVNGEPWHYDDVVTNIEKINYGDEKGKQYIRMTFIQERTQNRGKNWVIIKVNPKTSSLRGISFDRNIPTKDGIRNVNYNVDYKSVEDKEKSFDFTFNISGNKISGQGSAKTSLRDQPMQYNKISQEYRVGKITELKFENIPLENPSEDLKALFGK